MGIGLFFAAVALVRQLPTSIHDANREFTNPFPIVREPIDIILSCVKYLFSGFSEELITRCYLITRLSLLLRSKATGILIAAILFSSYHVYQDFVGVIYTLLFGFVYGTVFICYRRIWPLVIGHAIYNIQSDYLAWQF